MKTGDRWTCPCCNREMSMYGRARHCEAHYRKGEMTRDWIGISNQRGHWYYSRVKTSAGGGPPVDVSFYFGVLAALAVVALHDQETLYREIVNTVDEDKLVRVARANGDMKWSGLSRYHYGSMPRAGRGQGGGG